jgi:galactonate dehydratase
MKIVKAEIFDSELGKGVRDHPVLVRLTTDEGITGVGEVGLAYGTGHSAGAAYARNLAETFIIGADPFKTEKLWESMLRNTFWALGGGPVVYGGMSALDEACWDIKGKALGLPVYQLLGGKTNESLRTYASQIQFGWSPDFKALVEPEEYAEEARIAVAEGYDAIKVDPVAFDENGVHAAINARNILTNKHIDLFYNRVGAIRDAVGPDVDIIIELHSSMSVTTAIQMGQLWEDFDCMYFEEPSNYINAKLQDKIARSVNIPMAGGERIYTRWGYRQYFEDQSLDVIQPDLQLVGGISEGKKICDYAEIYDITVQLHVCGSPVATAIALQLEAVIPNFLIHEHHTNAIKPYMRGICVQNYQPENGKFTIPDLPGYGIELDEAYVKSQNPIIVK